MQPQRMPAVSVVSLSFGREDNSHYYSHPSPSKFLSIRIWTVAVPIHPKTSFVGIERVYLNQDAFY